MNPDGVHPVAAGGFSASASVYARIRPTYARAAIGRIAELVRATPAATDARVLDLAAGTGILTGQLTRARLACTALEPLDEMIRQLRRSLPSTPCARAIAESLPLRDRSFDAVSVAQAFHWFDARRALSEIARVLRPDGVVVLAWNVRDPSAPWVAELDDLVESRAGGRPYSDHDADRWAGLIGSAGSFGTMVEERFDNPIPTTVDGVIDRVRSISFVATMAEPDRDALLRAARTLLIDGHGLADTFDYPHHTVVDWATRVD